MRFTRHRKGIRAEVDDVEAGVLMQCAEQLLQLVEAPDVPSDPLAAMVGLPTGEVSAPTDPVLARLLPPAYRDDPDAANDFRRYTDLDLRGVKRRQAQVVLQTLPASGGRLELDRDQADAWLGCLNDLRLALGTSLEVTEETDLDDDAEFDEEDPQAAALSVYSWLGYLQESLLSCLDPRS